VSPLKIKIPSKKISAGSFDRRDLIPALKELTASQLVKKFPALCGSSPHSQQPATCVYPEPVQSSPYPIPFLNIHFNIILSSTPEEE
jgi:hypothetical protein